MRTYRHIPTPILRADRSTMLDSSMHTLQRQTRPWAGASLAIGDFLPTAAVLPDNPQVAIPAT
jgi:hypothetical protein